MVQDNLNKNLLVVEDERVIGNICHRVLTKEGFNVVVAGDGNTALVLLGKYHFDLCLLDIRTPGIGGLELYTQICQLSPNLSSKVIFMTGDSLSKNIPEFVTKVGCQLLEKPFTTQELISAVNNVQNGWNQSTIGIRYS